jgi:Reverse transcriptase (RNA-dependent DNA polymerase)/gag-polypeptide of LTR copia-type/Zinc knuckle
MTDFNSIRVIPFYGKSEEWPTWSEKFLAKARRYGFKDVLLGKARIPKTDEDYEMDTEEGKRLMIAADLNELAYTELILSIDDKTSNGKVAFNLVKGCKNKDFVDGNASMAWDRLRNKFEPQSAPSLVKMEKQFRQCALKKGQDPDVWITELEDYRMKLDELGSSISNNQFIIHILNNMTDDYELQLAMMEKRLNDKINLLTVDEIRDDLNLRFERLNIKTNENNENGNNHDVAFFGGQFKGKCRNCGVIGHKARDCKNKFRQNGGQNSANQNGGQNGGNQNNFQGNSSNGAYCNYCRRPGHHKGNCFKLKNRSNHNSGTSSNDNQERRVFNSDDVALTSIATDNNFSNDTWIFDSGASCHYCQSMEGLTDVKDIDELIKIGNGGAMRACKTGNLNCEVTQLDGRKFVVTLNNVKYVPDICSNLFSLNKALRNGFKLSNNNVIVSLTKKHVTLTFDRVIKTIDDGCVTGVMMRTISAKQSYDGFAHASIEMEKSFDINHLHRVFGHCGLETLKNTVKLYGLKYSGDFETCEECAVAKARQKNVNKNWSSSSNIPGERLYIDISSIKESSFGGAKFWALIVDDCTDYCWSFVMKNKSDLKGKVKTLLTDLKIAGINVKFIRCDDAGENMSMKNDHDIKSFGVKFEFSGPRTPQRNGKVERKFQTFYGRIRSMLNGAGLKGDLRNKIWAECVMTTTYLSNVLSTKSSFKSPSELLFGAKPILQNKLKIFGEVGVVTTKDKIQAKLTNRGTPCIFVGYAENHSKDVYRMLNLETNAIINSRDIIWLKKMQKDWLKNKLMTIIEEEDVMELPIGNERNNVEEAIPNVDEIAKKKANNRVVREMKKLESWFNPQATKVIEDYDRGRAISLEQVNLALFTTAFIKEPSSFEEAVNCEKQEDQDAWKEAINKELKEMSKRGVWEVIDEKDVPNDRRCIKNKWIFKVKRNGVFRARLVACGYSQVPGVDFTESFAPVLNDVSFRLMLIAKLVWDMTSTVVDIETAFLHGDLDEEIYMDVPMGLSTEPNKKLLLRKTIYGLVQSARKFYKKLIDVLKVIGFEGSKSDPCLWTMWDSIVNHMLIVGIYVDDCLIIGKESSVSNLLKELKKHEFNLKIEKDVVEYLSCCIIETKNEAKLTMIQPHLLTRLNQKFGEEIKDMRKYMTPGTPRFKIQRSINDMEVLDSEHQRNYRSGVGMLLYLTKYSRPDISNIVRELSKCMDSASWGSYQELLRVIKFVDDTKSFGLKVQPRFDDDLEWNLKIFCDSDWAGDPETRISVTGFVIYLLDVPVCWRSKSQKGVTLSSTEAEYVAISEAVKEVKFVYYLLCDLHIKVKLPIVVKTDNIGAIFMSENASTGVRTRHVDTRYHFVREFIEDGFIKVEFVRSVENDADIFTKNVSHDLYVKHTKNFLADEGNFSPG